MVKSWFLPVELTFSVVQKSKDKPRVMMQKKGHEESDVGGGSLCAEGASTRGWVVVLKDLGRFLLELLECAAVLTKVPFFLITVLLSVEDSRT